MDAHAIRIAHIDAHIEAHAPQTNPELIHPYNYKYHFFVGFGTKGLANDKMTRLITVNTTLGHLTLK